MFSRILLLSFSVALLPACSDDSNPSGDEPLAEWAGSWVSQGVFLDDPAMDAAYAAIAAEYNATYAEESGTTHTTESVRAHWQKLYSTDFATAEVDGSTITYRDVDGAEIASCNYVAPRACTEVFYSGPDNAWSLTASEDAWSETWCPFETSDGGACATFRTVILTEFHVHEDDDAHGHLRYGDLTYEQLWDDRFDDHGRDNHYWWPTLLDGATTAADYAAQETENAAGNAEYLTY
jgi:hypothetical protein